jgi:phosphohistidine swiveling domain-containing protein
MRVVWTAVNRTRSGAIIGENERLTPYEAIKGLPIGVLINILKKAKRGL